MKTKTKREVMQWIAEEVSKTKEKQIPEKTHPTIKPKARYGSSVYVSHNFEDPCGKFHFKN